MSTPAYILLAATIAQLLRVLVGHAGLGRFDRGGWAATAGLAAWQFRHDGLLIAIVPVYVLASLVLMTAVLRHVRQTPGTGSRRRHVLTRIALVTVSLPLTAVPVIDAVVVPIDVDDLSDETWSTAFDRLHRTLRSHYAFGDWKRIDWDRLHASHSPAVVAAERAGDEDAYYRAVRGYVFAIPDGHVSIDGAAHDDVRFAEIGGGFGLTLVRLEDGTAIAHIVDPAGPAAAAGMVWGAQIIEWNHIPIDEAVSATPTLWASRPSATTQTATVARHQLVTRAPVGDERSVTFSNPDGPIQTATLAAYSDDFRSLDGPEPWKSSGDELPVAHHMLDGGVGYVRVASLETVDGEDPAEALDRSMRAMGHANGLILDVRGNRGGWDGHVTKMMSYFTPTRLLYEHIALPAPLGDGKLRLWTLHVEPNEMQFTQPVAVLVDHRTKSSGEGFALVAKQLPNLYLIGSTATDGSFGMTGGSVLLPTDIEVAYPLALSVDGDDIVQLDGDHRLQGGVEPDIVVPMTFETAESIYYHGDDVTLDIAHSWLRQAR